MSESATFDGMKRIPCLICGAVFTYNPMVPGLREATLEKALRHMLEH